MKLFKTLSALAVVKAQVPDFSDLNALFASLTNDLADVRNEDPIVPVQDNAAGARYLVATTTLTTPASTTTPPPVTTTAAMGTGCWKCDAMSFTACATGGYFQTCSPDQTNGDNGVCFLEMRETNQYLTQLCTGCKDRQACYDLRRQNFVGSSQGGSRMRQADQCKPEWLLQRYNRRYGNQQSTCRTCFNMCDSTEADGNKCFGGLDYQHATAAAFFKYPDVADMATGTSVISTGALNSSARSAVTSDVNNLGIPLGIQAVAAPNIAYVKNSANMVVWGGYQGDTGHGKDDTQANRAGPKYNPADPNNPTARPTEGITDLYLFWAIQDQPKAWWEYDHADLQIKYQSAGDTPADIQATDISTATGFVAGNGLM